MMRHPVLVVAANPSQRDYLAKALGPGVIVAIPGQALAGYAFRALILYPNPPARTPARVADWIAEVKATKLGPGAPVIVMDEVAW